MARTKLIRDTEADPQQSFEPDPAIIVEFEEGQNADYGTSPLNPVQVSVHWGADGSISIARGPNSIGFNADGDMVIANGNSTIRIVAATGAIQLIGTTGGGILVEDDGTVTVGDVLYINPDGTYELNGAQWLQATADGFKLHLLTSDPAVAGALWDNGSVRVSGSTVGTVTVQTGSPVGNGYLTPLVYDDTAVTGGLYGWNGSDYVQVGGLV